MLGHRLVLRRGPIGPLHEAQHSSANVALRNLGKSGPSPVSYQLVGHAAADAVEQEVEGGVLEDASVPGRGQTLDVSRGVFVHRAFRSERRVANLARRLAELG